LEILGIDSNDLPKDNRAVESVEFNVSNYPNPFNPTTTINYALRTDEKVVIKA
jgi:hypothetical protein